MRKLSQFEKETIINFNEAESEANIFTYNKMWQKHLEGKLGLKPTMDNGFGGKEYQIDKKRIKPPKAKRRLSPETKTKLAVKAKTRFTGSVLSSQNNATAVKLEDKNPS